MPYVVFKGAHGGPAAGQGRPFDVDPGPKRLGTAPTHIVPEPGGQGPCPEGPGAAQGFTQVPTQVTLTS